MRKTKKLKKAMEDIIKYSKGETIEGLRVYYTDQSGKRREVIERLEIIKDGVL